MREIKFRAWDDFNAEYIYSERINTPPRKRKLSIFFENCAYAEEGENKITIEQFTGLHDGTQWEDLTQEEKNDWLKIPGNTADNWPGKEIYEGDIVKDEFEDTWIIQYYTQWACFIIRWATGGNTIDSVELKYHRDEVDSIAQINRENLNYYYWKIIGNIHENPELLNK